MAKGNSGLSREGSLLLQLIEQLFYDLAGFGVSRPKDVREICHTNFFFIYGSFSLAILMAIRTIGKCM